MRTVVVHRADKITGPYEGKMVLQDKGVAQGGLIDTRREMVCPPVPRLWLCRAYSFPVPVKWEDGWPVLGENGRFLNSSICLPIKA